MSFAKLKKNRSQSLQKLADQLDKMNSRSYVDPDKDKYWRPTRDAAGNAFAIIRFLPEPDGEDFPFVQIWDHGFQGPTGLWYIEKSLRTIGKDDPVAKYNSKLWNSTTDDNSPARAQARKQRQRLKYHSNILVIKDSAKPENEGKVFLYEYGKKIFDKLNNMMNPEFEDETPVNPFDFWEGANFRLKVTGAGRDTNYDKSTFDDPSPLFDGDEEKLEEVYNKLYSLQELKDESKFKTYEELEAKLFRVLGISEDSPNTPATDTADDLVDKQLDMSNLQSDDGPSLKESSSNGVESSDDEDDEEMEFFKSLASK